MNNIPLASRTLSTSSDSSSDNDPYIEVYKENYECEEEEKIKENEESKQEKNENLIGYDYRKLYENSKTWVPSFEKSLVKCLYYTFMKTKSDGVPAAFNKEITKNDILNECDHMSDRLKIEGLDTNDNKIFLEDVKNLFTNEYWKEAHKKLDEKRTSIKVLDIDKIRELIDEINTVQGRLSKKDIILFLGTTGSGKSTTIHFLCGSRMTEGYKYGLKNIEPTPNEAYPELRKVTTSPLPRSETQFVIAIEIEYKSFNVLRDGSIFLCDTPGFEDTKGAEVDIANAVGMVKVIKSCQTVRPVILISETDYQFAKMQGLKNLAHLIVGLINDPQSYLPYFSFLLTKFSKEQQIEFKNKLNSLIEIMLNDKSENKDESLLLFCGEFKTKLDENEAKFVNPIDDNRNGLLKHLVKVDPIQRPHEVFKFSISHGSRAAIKEQLRIHQLMIKSSLNAKDYKFVDFKLREIKYLNDLLEDQCVTRIYQECISMLINTLQDHYTEAIDNFKNNLKYQIDEKAIEEFQLKMDAFKFIDEMRVFYGIDEVPSSEILHNCLKEQCLNLVNEIKSYQLDDRRLKDIMDKLKLLSLRFGKIEDGLKLIHEKVLKLVTSFKDDVASKKYSDSAKEFTILKNALLMLAEHFESNTADFLVQMKKVVLNHFDNLIRNMTPVLQKDNLVLDDINCLIRLISIFDSAKEAYRDLKEIYENVVAAYESYLEKVVDRFDRLNDKILSIYENDRPDALANMESLFKQLSLFMKISAINAIISSKYYSTLEKICGCVETIKLEINNILITNLSNEKNCEKLYNFVNTLESSKWIEEYKPGNHEKVMNFVRDSINNQFKALKNHLADNNLELCNYENIKDAANTIQNILCLKPFAKFIPEFDTSIDQTQKNFKFTITTTISHIKHVFDLNNKPNADFLPSFQIQTAEYSLLYLTECCQINLLNQIECKGILLKFTHQIQEYANLVDKELDEKISSIMTYSDSEKKEILFNNTRHLYNRAKEFAEINKQKELNEIFNKRENLLEKLKSKLNDCAHQLREEVERLQITRAVTQSYTIMDITKALRLLDEIIGIKLFDELYDQIFKNVKENAPTILNNFNEALQRKDFMMMLRLLNDLDSSKDPLIKHYFIECKYMLNNQINRWIEDANLKIKFFTISTTEETKQEFSEIVSSLSLLDNVIVLNAYIEETINIQKCKEAIKKNITDLFMDSLHNIANWIKSFNFASANLTIRAITRKIDALDSFYTESIKNEVKKLQDLFKTEVENLKKKYEDRDLEHYLMYPPDEDFKKLRNTINFEYDEIIESLNNIIIKKFRTELEGVSNIKTKRDKDQLLKKLRNILGTLPDNLKRTLTEDITRVTDNIEANERDVLNNLKTAIANKNLKFLEVYINEGRASHNTENMSIINEFIQAETTAYTEDIKKSLENREIIHALSSLVSLNEYKIFCQKCLPTRQLKEYKNLCTMLSSQIESILTDLNEFFQTKFETYGKNVSSDPQSSKQICEYLQVSIDIFKLRKKHVELIDEILPNFYHKYIKIAKSIIDPARAHQMKFKEAIDRMNISLLKNILDCMKNLNPLMKEIKPFLENISNNEFNATKVIEKFSYDDMIEQVEKKINELKIYFDKINLFDEASTKNEHNRESYFGVLNTNVEILKELNKLQEHTISYLNLKDFETEMVNILVKKRDEVVNHLNNLLTKSGLSIDDCKCFDHFYSNLVCLTKINFDNLSSNAIVKSLENKFFELINKIKNEIEEADVKETAEHLIEIKTISDNVAIFKIQIDEKINLALKNFKQKKGSQAIAQLGTILNTNPIGKIVISEHAILEGFYLALFNDKIQKHKIDYVLKYIEDADSTIKIPKLGSRYTEFETTYTKLITEHLKPNLDLKTIVAEIETLFKKTNVKKWDARVFDKIPSLLGYLFALWTLNNSKHYYDNQGVENQELYLLKPHPAQVISIFRLLGVGDDKEVLTNNLCQIGTGEGKSVTLAITSCIFAIFGYHVKCVCYSKYLSERDNKVFSSMFELLGIQNYIRYGTFDEICEGFINENGDLRKRVENLINGKDNEKGLKKDAKKTVLLIDEVDVFLSKNFYGNMYRPVASIRDSIYGLVELIWNKREENLTFEMIAATKEYKACCTKYKDWIFLIDNAVGEMIVHVKSFNDPPYIVENDRIGYVILDGISFNTLYGYKTLFAYWHEHKNGKITHASLKQNTRIIVYLGLFSYAEIPHQFDHIIGVSGTLKTLSEPEKSIVENAYQIKKQTFMPSVFGKNNLVFAEDRDVFIETAEDYHNRISREIECRLKGKNPGTKRAVLVFFESRKELLELYNSNSFAALKDAAKILTEEDNLTLLEKDKFIKDATRSGAVSLITRSFGRGTDFVCRDDIVLANGGVHVLQTFLSEQLSEEIQIKGRTARQGDLGSYSMVLLDKSLEKFYVKPEEIEANRGVIYKFLNEKRNSLFEKKFEDIKAKVEAAKAANEKSISFIKSLNNGNTNEIIKFLSEYNAGSIIE